MSAMRMLVKLAWKMVAGLVHRLGWGAALLPVSALGLGMFGVRPWTVALPVCALAVVACWPAVAAGLVPVAMVAAGICGLATVARESPWVPFGHPSQWKPLSYRILPDGRPMITYVPVKGSRTAAALVTTGAPGHGSYHGPLPAGILVPLALLLLALGLWLTPRMLASLWAHATRLLPYLRRWPQQGRWGVLLVPVAALGLAEFGVNVWTIAAVPVALLLVIRRPVIGADLVPPALAAFAGYGIAIALSWLSLASSGFPETTVSYGALRVGSPDMALLAGVEAAAFLAFSAWLVPRTIGAHVSALLGVEPDPGLAGRVQQLTQTRADAIDSAVAELRRIERDLHDGAQARLVALGISLRAVEHMLPGSPYDALALVTEARQTSSRALADLRDLVRGICPPVLADRGLQAAVHALVLDTPLPVQLDIDLPGRLTAPVESACYFAVAELLANAARHSGARTVHLRVQHAAGMLRIEVADDGHGGADPASGSGLQGVERRLGTFDGILAVSSPPGGPTMIAIEVPCALSSPKTCSC
jgi:signal transduction histidine kinase